MMVDKLSNFERILAKLDEINFNFSDLSFGEVMQVCVDRFRKTSNNSLSDFNDKELLSHLDSFLNIEKRKRGD